MAFFRQTPERFWAWFWPHRMRILDAFVGLQTGCTDVDTAALDKLVLETDRQLKRIDKRLSADLHYGADDIMEIAISAGGDANAFAAAHDVAGKTVAPVGWRAVGLVPRRGVPASVMVSGVELAADAFSCLIDFDRGQAQIALAVEPWDPARATDYKSAARMIVRDILGEEFVSLGVSELIAVPRDRLPGGSPLMPLAELAGAFDEGLAAEIDAVPVPA